MSDLSAFPITAKWPAQHPDRLQLYSLPTPNGVKVSIALEELGLPYEPHLVSFQTNDQLTPEFISLNPNKLMSQDPAQRYETIQWVMFQMGGIGPMFGQLGFFHKFAGKDFEDKRPRDRYVAESTRLLGVLDKHLAGRQWMVGDSYSIADIAIFPWVRNLIGFYAAGDLVGFADFPNVARVLAAFVARPAVERGLAIPA